MAKLKAMLMRQEPDGNGGFRLVPVTTAVWLTVSQAAMVLGCSNKSVYRVIESGHLAHTRIRKSYRISVEDLEDYMKRARVPADFERQMRESDF